jgi:hypothetical protein
MVLVGGIVLFLLGPTIPRLLDQYRAAEDLWYIVDGPVYFGQKAAYSVEVQNRGRALERNVELNVPTAPGTRVELEVDPFDFSQRPPPALRKEAEYTVASLGDLKAGETQRISVLASWEAPLAEEPGERFRTIPHVMPRVTASGRTVQHRAWRTLAHQAEMRAEWYRSSLDLMLAALVLLIVLLMREPAKDSPEPRAAPPAGSRPGRQRLKWP